MVEQPKSELILIAAMDQKRGIGKAGKIPWRIPEDRAHFKDLTMGHPVIMGSTTYLSIPEGYRPLKGRTNIVLTRNPRLVIPGVLVAHSLEEALAMGQEVDPEKIYVAGGANVYEQALPLVSALDLTLIAARFECDAFFPPYEDEFRQVVSSQSGSDNNYHYQFITLTRN